MDKVLIRSRQTTAIHATVNVFYELMHAIFFLRISYLDLHINPGQYLCYKYFFMTQRIIITILFLVTVSLGSNQARAGKLKSLIPAVGHSAVQLENVNESEMPAPVKSQP